MSANLVRAIALASLSVLAVNTATAAGPSDPTVQVVAGRTAVTFDGNDFLASTFRAPAAITGSNPFTVAVLAYNPKIAGEECMVQWAHRGAAGRCAQLNYGNAPAWGAVTHWTGKYDMGFDGGVPSAGAWHHIAATCEGGKNGIEQIWVDGVLNSSETKTLNLWPGDPVRLGSSEKGHWFSGSLASVQIYDYALSIGEIANLAGKRGMKPRSPLVDLDAADLSTGPLKSWVNKGTLGGGFGALLAFDPWPKDGDGTSSLTVVLRWSPGDLAKSHDVYFGRDKAEIENARNTLPTGTPKDSRVYKGNRPSPDNDYGPIPLQLGETYYWRIDALNAKGVAEWGPGKVWTIRANTGKASEPVPRDRGLIPAEATELRWTPGIVALSQDIYFGTNEAEVRQSEMPLFRGLAPKVRQIAIPGLPAKPDVAYYWRVDSINGALPTSKGDIWTFRTKNPLVYDDITFFVVSDTHYGLNENEPTDEATNKAIVDEMNTIPGTEYPAFLGGGVVHTPRGVLHCGDMTNSSSDEEWRTFLEDYGVNGEGRINYSVYEAFGNHDGGSGSVLRNDIRKRNLRRPRLSNISKNGLHYSWDWDQVHFVNLGISPGLSYHPYDPENSREFLRKDLAKEVGDSGRPVVLCHHFGFDRESLGWWPEEDRITYYDAIKGYNVIGIFHGHSHRSSIYTWNGIDAYDVSHMRAGPTPSYGFFIVHIAQNEMVVVERKSDHTWGVSSKKSISGTD